jgi:excisionase family DNA binding protein
MLMADEAKKKAFYTLAELMERWSVSRSTIYREIARGRLKRIHVGSQIRFPAKAVAEYEKDRAGD